MRRACWLLIVLCLPYAVHAPATYAQQQTVAVVYDDSGSMLSGSVQGGRRWAYANYALQTLTGLLAEDDRLLVIPMSRAAQVDTLMLAEQATLDTLRASPPPVDGSPTPYASLQTAIEALEGAGGEDLWLLVITDGEFSGTPPPEVVRARVEAFVERTGARVLFLLIGEDAADVEAFAQQPAVAVWRETAQASVYRALGRQDIVAQMQRIAADITARAAGAGPRIDRQGEQIEVTTELPLRRLTLLQQAPAASGLAVLEAARAEGGRLRDPRALRVAMPQSSTVDLFGRITHLTQTAEGTTIPAGTIRLAFAGGAEDVDVLPEVAARLAVRFLDAEGNVLAGQGGLIEPCRGSSVRMEAAVLGPEGDTLTATLRRPADLDVRLRLDAAQQAMTLSPSGTRFERLLAVPDTAVTASVSAVYPGYFNFQSPLYTLRGRYCAPPRALSLEAGAFEAPLDAIPEGDPVPLTPRADGQPVSAADFERWMLEVVDAAGLNLEVVRGADGWTLRPRPRRPLWQLTPAGSFEVVVEAHAGDERETPARAVVPVTLHDLGFWAKWGVLLLWLLALLVLLWYLVGILRKPRFARGSGINYQRVQQGGVTRRQPAWHPLPTHWANRWLVPYRAERRRVEGMPFIAAPKRFFVFLPPEALSEAMTIAGLPVIEDPERPPERLRSLQNNETLRVRRGRSDERYTYLTAQQ